jgi:plasmid stability protein
MPAVTIRNLSEETHRALRVRAAEHGRRTEAEIRDILEKAAGPEGRIKLGSLLAAIGRAEVSTINPGPRWRSTPPSLAPVTVIAR